jgi:glycogen debranching enzyme
MFWSLAKDNSFIKVMTVSNLFPLLLPHLPDGYAEYILKLLRDPNKFWTPYPVPSVAADEPTFDPDRTEQLIWRGPSWININWYLVIGLMRHRFLTEAQELAERTIAMVEREGFWEFYQPFTGKGMRIKDFGWSTLAATFDSLI